MVDYEELWNNLRNQIDKDIEELKEEYERGYAVSRGYRSALHVVKDYMNTFEEIAKGMESQGVGQFFRGFKQEFFLRPEDLYSRNTNIILWERKIPKDL